MDISSKRPWPAAREGLRSVTIRDLAAELNLSITTISRALGGYSDVGEKTRRRVAEAAQRLGYRPNRNAQRLVTRRTHNIGWVQSDTECKLMDPHFVEVMAGVLRGASAGSYDIVLTSETPEREMSAYDRYVGDNSVDGFIIDHPRERDPRISYLLEKRRPFIVHGRDSRCAQYGWVDIDNYGNFYNLTRLLLTNGHQRIAFINGDEGFISACDRGQAVADALRDGGYGSDTVQTFSSPHSLDDAGYKLTSLALGDPKVTAILYPSRLMMLQGHAAMLRHAGRRDIVIASMDDGPHGFDLSSFSCHVCVVRSSPRAAGEALIAELIRQCEQGGPGRGILIPSSFQVADGMDARVLSDPAPARER